jgi:hypothetical protein
MVLLCVCVCLFTLNFDERLAFHVAFYFFDFKF